MKFCSSCKLEKIFSEFSKNKSRKDGLDNNCKKCRNLISKAWKSKNKSKIKQYNKLKYEENTSFHVERSTLWQKLNYEKFRLINRKASSKYAKHNKEKSCSRSAFRRSRKLKATPKWLNEHEIQQIKQTYLDCSLISEISGIKHHVDHIVPLVNDWVCGLHVPWNLQIITAEENLKKSNKF